MYTNYYLSSMEINATRRPKRTDVAVSPDKRDGSFTFVHKLSIKGFVKEPVRPNFEKCISQKLKEKFHYVHNQIRELKM